MLKWLFRIGLGLLVTKLAEEYMQPARRKSEKRTASRPAAKRRKTAQRLDPSVYFLSSEQSAS
jgi:hypothetical protein